MELRPTPIVAPKSVGVLLVPSMPPNSERPLIESAWRMVRPCSSSSTHRAKSTPLLNPVMFFFVFLDVLFVSATCDLFSAHIQTLYFETEELKRR